MRDRARTRLLAATGLVLALVAPTATAEESAAHWYAGASALHYNFDEDLDLDDSVGGGLTAGYYFDHRTSLEASWITLVTERSAATGRFNDVRKSQVQLDALYHGKPQGALQAYWLTSFAAGRFEPERGDDDDHIQIGAGGGARYYLSPCVALKGDTRLYYSDSLDAFDLTTRLSLIYHFGRGGE